MQSIVSYQAKEQIHIVILLDCECVYLSGIYNEEFFIILWQTRSAAMRLYASTSRLKISCIVLDCSLKSSGTKPWCFNCWWSLSALSLTSFLISSFVFFVFSLTKSTNLFVWSGAEVLVFSPACSFNISKIDKATSFASGCLDSYLWKDYSHCRWIILRQ